MSDLSATAVATAATETTDVVSTATEAVTPPPEPVAPPTQPSAPEPPAPEPQASAPTPGDSDSGIVDTVTQAADPDPVDPAPASEPEVVPDVHTVASTPDVSDTAVPSDVGATLTDAVSGAGSDVVAAPVVTDTLSSAGDVADGLAPVVTDTLSSATDVTGGVTPAVSDSVNAITAPFTSSADTSTVSLGGGVDSITAPFTSSVDSGAGSLGDGFAPGAEPVGDGFDAITAPFTTSVDVAGFTAAPTGDAAPVALSVLQPPTPPWSASGNGMDVDGVGAAATSLDGDALTDVMAQLAPDARLVASAAVLTLVSEAILGTRILGPRADARVAFTNVRLLPCLVKASLEQQVAALTGSRVPAASLGGANGAAETEGVGDTAASDEARGGVRGTIESFVSPLREGFDQATRDAGEATDGFSDSRLLVQVGMALGVVYLAFLSLWFWLTRVRWSSRA